MLDPERVGRDSICWKALLMRRTSGQPDPRPAEGNGRTAGSADVNKSPQMCTHTGSQNTPTVEPTVIRAGSGSSAVMIQAAVGPVGKRVSHPERRGAMEEKQPGTPRCHWPVAQEH